MRYINLLDFRNKDSYDNVTARLIYLHFVLFCRQPHNTIVISVDALTGVTGASTKAIRTALNVLIEDGLLIKNPPLEEVSEGGKKWGKQRANEGQTKGNQRATKGQTKGKKATLYKVLVVSDLYPLEDEEEANKGQTKGKRRANEGQTKGKQRATYLKRKEKKTKNNSDEMNSSQPDTPTFFENFNIDFALEKGLLKGMLPLVMDACCCSEVQAKEGGKEFVIQMRAKGKTWLNEEDLKSHHISWLQKEYFGLKDSAAITQKRKRVAHEQSKQL